MNLNELLSYLSEEYNRYRYSLPKKDEARKKFWLEHYSNNYEGPRDDSTGVPLHHQWEDKWPLLFNELKKPPKPRPPIEEDWMLGNHQIQRQKKYY